MPSRWPQAEQVWPVIGMSQNAACVFCTQNGCDGTSQECGPATSAMAEPSVAITGVPQACDSSRGSSKPPAIAAPSVTSTAP